MLNQFSRTAVLLGDEAMNTLEHSKVIIFGVGGVGGYVLEGLVRSGVGTIDIVDDDRVALTNINRQIIATTSTIGKHKIDVAIERAKDINPDVKITGYKCFYTTENADTFDFNEYDYVIDAIDTVSGKLEIIERATKAGTPVISSMGAGNKLDPTGFMVADISKTSYDPLAKVMRHELNKRGIKHCKVVYSKEEPITPLIDEEVKSEVSDPTSTTRTKGSSRRSTPGSISFVPSVVGLIIAGEVIKDLIKE